MDLRFQELLDHHSAPMFLVNPVGGGIVRANAAACAYYGYSREALEQLTVYDLNQASRAEIEQVITLATTQRSNRFCFRHRLASGEVRDVEVYTSPVPCQEGPLLFSIVHDITERRRSEEAQRRQARELRALSRCNEALLRATSEEALLDAVCHIVCEEAGYRMAWVGYAEHDETKRVRPVAWAGVEEGYISEASPTWDETERGRGPVGIALRTGRPAWSEDFAEDPSVRPWRQLALGRGYRSSVSLPLNDADGVTFGALMIYSAVPQDFPESEVHLLEELADNLAFGIRTHRERVRREQAEEERRRLETHLLRARKMESLGSLAGGVAHDINNMLGAILGLASTHRSLQPEGSPLAQAFDTITRACERGRSLARGLLDFASQDLTDARPLDLNALVRDTAALLERTTLKEIRLVLDLAPDLRLVNGNIGTLSHALMNLCVNAVDAMRGGGTLFVTTANHGPELVALVVRDTGMGMAPDVLEKAFDPYFTTKPRGRGTGLGLPLVYGAVQAHHGTLDLQSAPGQGTTVRIELPAMPSGVEPAEAPESALEKGEGVRILLVDDDDLVRFSVAEMLECLGHPVAETASGEEALVRIQGGEAFDLVLLDRNMPGLGGAATLKALRTLRPEVPVLLMTGKADSGAMELARTHGAGILAKPFALRELEDAVNRLRG